MFFFSANRFARIDSRESRGEWAGPSKFRILFLFCPFFSMFGRRLAKGSGNPPHIVLRQRCELVSVIRCQNLKSDKGAAPRNRSRSLSQMGGHLRSSLLCQAESAKWIDCRWDQAVCLQISKIGGRRIFIHLQCWEVLPFCRFQRQRCIKILCPKDPDFYTPLALKTAKGQHLPALEVYKNPSPNWLNSSKSPVEVMSGSL